MKLKRVSTVLIVLGILLLVAVSLLCLNWFQEEVQVEESTQALSSQFERELQIKPKPQAEKKLPGPDDPMPTINIEGHDYIGKLALPALSLELPVMSEWSYPKLKVAPCRYSGSAYAPGFSIAAHDYNAHFRQLHTLQVGGEITFTDVDDNVFTYEVVEVTTIDPTDVEAVTSDEWDLSLFTCVPNGTRRTVVHCMKVE